MGEKRDKGDKGDPGSSVRIVAPEGTAAEKASCESDEVMIGAWCTGTYDVYPRRSWPTRGVLRRHQRHRYSGCDRLRQTVTPEPHQQFARRTLAPGLKC